MPEGLDIERSSANLEKLLAICGRRGRALVLMQNSPDPDAIASAAAIREIASQCLGRRVEIGYGGMLGRAENRAMVEELGIKLRRFEPGELSGFKTICLVDTQPYSGNNVLEASRTADVVIDHHIRPPQAHWSAELCDIRPFYGATSTILYEYMLAARIEPDARLATALYYGIRSDTQELGRETCPADIEAFTALVPLMDRKRMAHIRRAPVPPSYFSMLRCGLSNAEVAGSAIITLVRKAGNPDIFAEVAELMLRLEGMRTSVCYGDCGGTIHLSARALDMRGNVAAKVRRVVRRIGTGGGHYCMAGGQISLPGAPEASLPLVRERILAVFAPGHASMPLLDKTLGSAPCATKFPTPREQV